MTQQNIARGGTRLALVGLALACGFAEPADARNLAFKLEREFAVIRENPNDPNTAFLNIYLVSFPLRNGLPDVAHDGAQGGRRGCVGDPGGPSAPDGRLNSMDALCELWTDRAIPGAMILARFDRDNCAFVWLAGASNAFGIFFNGPVFDLEADAGLRVTVSSHAVPAPRNLAVIVGSHDPTYTGRAIRDPALGPAGRDCTPRLDIINVPYHSAYQKAREILCGLYGVDWVYLNPPTNTKPSACNNGIFNDAPGFRKGISVLMFDNINDGSSLTQDNSHAHAGVGYNTLSGHTFSGTDLDIAPGEAYIVSLSAGHGQTTFLSPHF